MQADSYNKLAPLTIFYHWAVALLMICALSFGLYLDSLDNATQDPMLVYVHANVGVLIFILALARIFWRYSSGLFQPLGQHKVWEKKSAYWIHLFLLFSTIAMPLSGMMMVLGYGCARCVVPVFGLFYIGPFPKMEIIQLIGSGMHHYGSKVVIAAILLHAGGCVKTSLLG